LRRSQAAAGAAAAASAFDVQQAARLAYSVTNRVQTTILLIAAACCHLLLLLTVSLPACLQYPAAIASPLLPAFFASNTALYEGQVSTQALRGWPTALALLSLADATQ
jgi:hypothetical protein